MARPPSAARVVFLLIVAAVLAAVANLAAPSQRKLAWVGEYPRALEVGPPLPERGARNTGQAAGVPQGAAVSPAAPASPQAGAEGPATPPPAPQADAAVPDSGKTFPPHPDRAAVEIGPADVELLYRRKAIFLDARRSEVYTEAHIAGARSFPVWEADIGDRVKSFYEEGLDQQAPIVIYCSGGNCEDSHMLAEKLYMVGFDNVLIYKEGFPDWQKRGLPVSKGANP